MTTTAAPIASSSRLAGSVRVSESPMPKNSEKNMTASIPPPGELGFVWKLGHSLLVQLDCATIGGLGFRPLYAAGVCLIANTAPVAFGAIGIPVVALAGVMGYGEMLVKMDHPTIGELPLVGSPLKMSDTPVEYRLHPPLMGEHTEELLRELGYKNDEERKV